MMTDKEQVTRYKVAKRNLMHPASAGETFVKVVMESDYQSLEQQLEQSQAEVKKLKEPKLFPLQVERGRNSPTKIPWSVADKAYSVYSAKYSSNQSLKRLAERGGFGQSEMDMFYPEWEKECSELQQSQKTIESLKEELKTACKYWMKTGKSGGDLYKINKKLVAGLSRYGSHEITCEYNTGGNCTCGLELTLQTLADVEGE